MYPRAKPTSSDGRYTTFRSAWRRQLISPPFLYHASQNKHLPSSSRPAMRFTGFTYLFIHLTKIQYFFKTCTTPRPTAVQFSPLIPYFFSKPQVYLDSSGTHYRQQNQAKVPWSRRLLRQSTTAMVQIMLDSKGRFTYSRAHGVPLRV